MNIILPLVMTLCLETGIYMILKHKDLKLFIVVSVMNLVLNPLMNIGLLQISDRTLYWVVLSIAEIATTFIESVVVYFFLKEKYLKVLLFAGIANALSFVVGLIFSFTPIYETKIAIIIVSSLFVVVYLVSYIITLSSSMSHYRDRNDDSSRDEKQGQ